MMVPRGTPIYASRAGTITKINVDYPGSLAGNAVIRHLPGVAHYDFLSECTLLGADRLQGLCRTAVPKAATHAAAVDEALRFFGENLR